MKEKKKTKKEPKIEKKAKIVEEEPEEKEEKEENFELEEKIKSDETETNEEEIIEEEPVKVSFTGLGIKPWLNDQLEKLQIKFPTVIQENCIPPTLQGKDIIGMSQTGTGKTVTPYILTSLGFLWYFLLSLKFKSASNYSKFSK
jgi:hypothetical protein